MLTDKAELLRAIDFRVSRIAFWQRGSNYAILLENCRSGRSVVFDDVAPCLLNEVKRDVIRLLLARRSSRVHVECDPSVVLEVSPGLSFQQRELETVEETDQGQLCFDLSLSAVK
jgi:hypothetical protein